MRVLKEISSQKSAHQCDCYYDCVLVTSILMREWGMTQESEKVFKGGPNRCEGT